MNRHKAKEMLPLIQALADGKMIQRKFGESWVGLDHIDAEDAASKYRTKPELTDPNEWNWSNAPTWAVGAAMDGDDNSWWYYSGIPEIRDNATYWGQPARGSFGSKSQRVEPNPAPAENWRESWVPQPI